MAYERDNIRSLDPYVPGEQPDLDTELQVVKLNTNENPYPPAAAVLETLRHVDGERLRRYPSATARRFRETAARIHGLSTDSVIATNGGDELLRLVVTVFCDPDGANRGGPGLAKADNKRVGVGISVPSYSLVEVLAQIHGTRLTEVPLDEDFSLPDDFGDRLNRAGVQLALVVNPQAPSGRLEPLEKLSSMAKQFDGVVVIDEAYVDFATHDALPLLKPDRRLGRSSGLDNVLILRSMSKGYSLAGLRFGYGLGHPDLIAALDKARDSYNTGVLAQLAATTALEHRQDAARTWQRVIEQRQRLESELVARGYTLMPSQANFLLATPPRVGPDAAVIYETLKRKGLLVRYFDQERLYDKLRITIGTAQQVDKLLKVLDDERGGK